MKSSLLAVILSLICYAGLAQDIPKGSTLIDGDITFYQNKEKLGGSHNNNQGLSVGLSGAKAVATNTFVGLTATYGNSKYDMLQIRDNYQYERMTNSNAYMLSVFLRKYIPLANKFYGYVEPRIGYRLTMLTDSTNTHSYHLSVIPGLTYNIYKKLYLDLSLESL